MFSWLLVIILSYFFFSLSFLGDKLVLAGAPKPISYTFYIGVLSVLVVCFIPFAPFGFPTTIALWWMILEAIVYLVGLYAMFSALEKFDVSVVITAIGATQPILIFILLWFFFGPQAIKASYLVAFLALIIGSVIISYKKRVKLSSQYIGVVMLASLMFSLDYIFSKLVFLHQPFLQGFIWMRIISFIFVLFFFVSKKFRKEIFEKKNQPDKKTGIIFFCTQACGGVANLLQSLAIFLAPVTFLPIVNALRGIQYVFLFLMTLALSLFLPRILKEEISKKIIVQKVISIVFIFVGLAILALY